MQQSRPLESLAMLPLTEHHHHWKSMPILCLFHPLPRPHLICLPFHQYWTLVSMNHLPLQSILGTLRTLFGHIRIIAPLQQRQRNTVTTETLHGVQILRCSHQHPSLTLPAHLKSLLRTTHILNGKLSSLMTSNTVISIQLSVVVPLIYKNIKCPKPSQLSMLFPSLISPCLTLSTRFWSPKTCIYFTYSRNFFFDVTLSSSHVYYHAYMTTIQVMISSFDGYLPHLSVIGSVPRFRSRWRQLNLSFT